MKTPSLHELPFQGKHVPHIVIEVNQKCNISCHACYKDKGSENKPLHQIKEEIQTAVRLRNISTITLAGGEPTLHPHLLLIISYIRKLKKDVQIASNGLNLSNELLRELKDAGVKEIYVHIDSLQQRPDGRNFKSEQEYNKLREVISEKVKKSGMVSSQVATIYRQNIDQLEDIISFALKSKAITRCLFTCNTEFANISSCISSTKILGSDFQSAHYTAENQNTVTDKQSNETVSLTEISEILAHKFNMEPVSFLGSNLDDKKPRWLVYYNFVINSGDQFKVLNIGSQFGKVVSEKIQSKIQNNETISFGKVLDTKSCILFCLYYAFSSRSLRTTLEVLSFLSLLLKNDASILYKDFTFQQGPELHEDGSFEYCRSCPDATIRDGVLVPVCLADSLKRVRDGAP